MALATVFVICGDPGGAEAIAPVIHELHDDQRLALTVHAYRQSAAVFRREGIDPTILSESCTEETCAHLLAESRAACLLTGTSVNGIDLERKFLAAADVADVPSITVLDFWSNLRRRFAAADGGLQLPTLLAVMDQHVRDEMVAAGFPAELFVVTGQPAFDRITGLTPAEKDEIRQQVRTRLKIATDQKLVVFVSQPLTEIHGFDCAAPGHVGYTEHAVLECLLRSAAELNDRDLIVWIRLHPRDQAGTYASITRPDGVLVLEDQDGTGRESLLAADVVVGMNSVLLLEAALLGKATISLQPGLRQPDSLPLQRLGLGTTVREADEFTSCLRAQLQGAHAAQVSVSGFHPGAARRCAKLVKELAGIN